MQIFGLGILESEIIINEYIAGGQILSFKKSDFDNNIDWENIQKIFIETKFNDSSDIYFDFYNFGMFGYNNKFSVIVQINEETIYNSLIDLTKVINDSKAAGIYYDERITFEAQDNVFMINISEVNGGDYLL